jgi:hypothetical protein
MFWCLVSFIFSDGYDNVPAGETKTLSLSAGYTLTMVEWNNVILKVHLNGKIYLITPSDGYTIFQFKEAVSIDIDATSASSKCYYFWFGLPEVSSSEGLIMHITNQAYRSINQDWVTSGTKKNLLFTTFGKYTLSGSVYTDSYSTKAKMFYYTWTENTEKVKDGYNFFGPFENRFSTQFVNSDSASLTFTGYNLAITGYLSLSPTIPLLLTYTFYNGYTAGKSMYENNEAVGPNNKFKTIESFPVLTSANDIIEYSVIYKKDDFKDVTFTSPTNIETTTCSNNPTSDDIICKAFKAPTGTRLRVDVTNTYCTQHTVFNSYLSSNTKLDLRENIPFVCTEGLSDTTATNLETTMEIKSTPSNEIRKENNKENNEEENLESANNESGNTNKKTKNTLGVIAIVFAAVAIVAVTITIGTVIYNRKKRSEETTIIVDLQN